MDTVIGLIDIYPDRKEAESTYDGRESVVSFYDHIFMEEYDRLMQRLITRIEVNECGTEKSYRLKAIWDTGATVSCISSNMAQRMGLHPADNGIGVTPAGQMEIMYYFLDVRLSDAIKIQHVKAAGFPLERHDADFLIGMDIISKGSLGIRNENGKTAVTFEL